MQKILVKDDLSFSAKSDNIIVGPISLDAKNRLVKVNDHQERLSKTEYILLKMLMQNAGRIQTRIHLESHLYSLSEEINSNVLEVHIHHLRKKIGCNFIKTVRGVGYMVNKI